MISLADALGRRRMAAAGQQTPTWAEAAWELPPGPQAAGAARAVLRGWLAGLGIGAGSEAGAGIVAAASELAGNAGVHGSPPLTLTVFAAGSGDGTQVIVTVADASPGVPRPRQAGEMDESGRGLAIILGLADWLETGPGPCGKQVRFGVTVPGLALGGGAGITGPERAVLAS